MSGCCESKSQSHRLYPRGQIRQILALLLNGLQRYRKDVKTALDAVEAGADGLRQLALLGFRSQLLAAHAMTAPLSGLSLRLLETEWATKFTEILRDHADVAGVYIAITVYTAIRAPARLGKAVSSGAVRRAAASG